MSIDFEKFKRKLDEWVDSDESNAYFENERKKLELKQKRFSRFEEWVKHNDFDKLMYKLVLMHGEEWREKCWHNGYEVHPNNVLEFIIDYVTHSFEPVSIPQIESEHFPTSTWFFRGYYFQQMFGQGTVTIIYNAEDLKCILSV